MSPQKKVSKLRKAVRRAKRFLQPQGSTEEMKPKAPTSSGVPAEVKRQATSTSFVTSTAGSDSSDSTGLDEARVSAAVQRSRDEEVILWKGIRYAPVTGGLKVLGAESGVRDLVIPAKVQGRAVTVVAKGAFREDPTLRSVTLPNSVKTLGAEAFKGCANLQTVELPADLEVINAQTFEDCAALETVFLPYELKRISRRAFAGCVSLTELPHFVKTGISTVMVVDRNIIEHSLPTALARIGEEAFLGCSSLRKVVVPYRVRRIRKGAFTGCASLEAVWLHAHLGAIEEGAFSGCASLERLKVPESVSAIGDRAFSAGTVVVCVEGSAAHDYALQNGLSVDNAELPTEPLGSQLGSTQGLTVSEVLANPQLLQAFEDRYDIRPAMEEVDRSGTASNSTPVRPSRFELFGDAYRPLEATGAEGVVSIAMVGDLMCRFRQQSTALADGVYDFTESFQPITSTLAEADLAIGNMETMVAESYPYMHETMYVDDRPHLNSPFAYLAAIRHAGFDVVMNAQNHMYDAGTKGVFETLESLNRAQLVHGGMYASAQESRFLLFDVKGIRIGIVSYLDQARQKMKQANFSVAGLQAMASHFEEERVIADIAAARQAGADFVIAYCHWGREYTDEITIRQAGFARMVAEAGADYIFGSHSHCPQPYTILETDDGRLVPVIYSGGNFISDIGLKKPITQDTFIAQLKLTRKDDGSVVVAEDSYLPCRIIEEQGLRGFVRVVPAPDLLRGAYGYSPLSADEDIRRISEALGDQYRMAAFEGALSFRGADSEEETDPVARYTLRKPLFAEQEPTRSRGKEPFVFDTASGRWKREKDTAKGEAILMCTGSVMYDRTLERQADVGDSYQFRSMFKHMRPCFEEADLVVSGFESVVADMYPATAVMPRSLAGAHYMNARPEYLDALRYAGIDCLALAQPYNLDAGVRGVMSTEEAVRHHSLVPSGLGVSKAPLFEVNGVQISVLSYSIDIYRTRSLITEEGAQRVLNHFDPPEVERAVRDARFAGAQFVLGYLDCRSTDGRYRLAERLEAARSMAECGVDYVVCLLPGVVSRYRKHKTSDGRVVPIATSLGTLAGEVEEVQPVGSAVLRLVVRPTPDGVEVEDSYIPTRQFEYFSGGLSTVVPASPQYNRRHHELIFEETRKGIQRRLGEVLKPLETRKVWISTHYQPQLSPAEISEVLGVEFSVEDKERLGADLNEKVQTLVTRKGDLREGCVAVLATHYSYRRELDQLTIKDVVQAGATMVISTQAHPELPCLIVDDPWQAYAALTGHIRDSYDPITVAITGTVGKTTAKELMARVFDRHYRTLTIEGNNNTLTTVGLIVQKLSAQDEAYVQEVHGGHIGSASSVSKLIKPDICLITNIGDGHLGQMGTIENVIEGKMQIIDGLREGGVLIINNDNEYLREQHPPVEVIRYSMSDSDCDYYAQNIQDSGEKIEFQIVSPDGVYDALLNFQGLHNVGNAVGVFAAARCAGVPAHKIIAGLSRYIPDSVRQNLIELGGYKLLIDTYSSTPASVISAAQTLCAVPVRKGGRRIAVVGDIPDQGDKTVHNHREVGSTLGELDFDLLLCCGEDSRHIVETAREAGMDAHYFADRKIFNRTIADSIRPGDVVLFKGGTRVHLVEETVRPLFGNIV